MENLFLVVRHLCKSMKDIALYTFLQTNLIQFHEILKSNQFWKIPLFVQIVIENLCHFGDFAIWPFDKMDINTLAK